MQIYKLFSILLIFLEKRVKKCVNVYVGGTELHILQGVLSDSKAATIAQKVF